MTTRFSGRLPPDLAANRVAAALERLARRRVAVLDLTESNPTKVGLAYPEDILEALARPESRVYDPQPLGLLSAREAVAGDYARRGLAVPADRIVLTASTSEAYSVLFKLLCDPGDELLVPRPSYPLFEHLTRLDAVGVRPYHLDYHGLWAIDRADLERAVSPRARAILVVNPNNPTGSCLAPRDLETLEQVAADHGLALIGDEVFADYPLEQAEWTSVLEARRVLTFGLGGLSKSAGLPQLKLGWMAVTGPDAAVRAALDRLEIICDTYLSVSTPVQQAAGSLIARGKDIRRQVRDRVRANYDQLRLEARRHPACRVLPAAAGWYAVMQVPGTRGEEALVLDLLEGLHVLVHPGYFFDFPREAFLVVSLLPPAGAFGGAIGPVLQRVSG